MNRTFWIGLVAAVALLTAQPGASAPPDPAVNAAITGNADCTITVDVRWKHVRVETVNVFLFTFDRVSADTHLQASATFKNARSAGKLSFTSAPELGPQAGRPFVIVQYLGPAGGIETTSATVSGTFCGLVGA